STRHFMREMNRLGVTSVIDAGGGFQNYPDDYAVIDDLARQDLLTVRIAYNLFTQRPKQELDDFKRWVGMTKPGARTTTTCASTGPARCSSSQGPTSRTFSSRGPISRGRWRPSSRRSSPC